MRKTNPYASSGLRAVVLFFAAALLGSCAKPPTEEMLRAEKALDAARSSEAHLYAGAELEAAQARFDQARELVAAHKYDGARAAAAEVEKLAHQATTLAGMRREKMKTETQQIIEEMQKRLKELHRQNEELAGRRAAERRNMNRDQLVLWEASLGAAEADMAAGNLIEILERLTAIRNEIEKNAKYF